MTFQLISPSWDEIISDLLDSKKMHDITFLVGEGPALKIFPAHRILVSAVSPAFVRLCHGVPRRGTVTIPQVDPDDFEAVLSHIYGKRVTIHSLQHSWNLLPVAKEYGLKALEVECKEYIINSISVESVCSIFEEARHQDEGRIILESFKFMIKNAKHLFKRKGIIGAHSNTVAAIIKQDCLNVDSEHQILTAVLEWADMECTLRAYQDNPNAFREVVRPLLRYIRFFQIGYYSLVKETKLFSALQKDEILDIGMNLFGHRSPGSPSWCNSLAKRRCAGSEFIEEILLIPCLCAVSEHKSVSCREATSKYKAKTGMFLSRIGFRVYNPGVSSRISAVISVQTKDEVVTTILEKPEVVTVSEQIAKLESPLYVRSNGMFSVSIKVEDYSPAIHSCRVAPFYRYELLFNNAPFSVVPKNEEPDSCFCVFTYLSLT